MDRNMNDKIYSIQGNSFKMLPLNLGLMNKAAPLLLKYRKLHFEYTGDIDTSRVENAEENISGLKTVIDELEDKEGDHSARITELKEKLQLLEEEHKNDRKLQSVIKLYNDCEGLAMYELLTSRNIIIPFLKNVLADAGGNIPSQIDNIDFNLAGAADFIKEVLTDFFTLTLQIAVR